ncbi:MAG: transposase zinc-binding domain-containing protein [Smithellaceae bacterium]
MQIYDDWFSGDYGFWRPYIEKVIYRYLDCGDLHNGFARVKCNDCGHEYLLAFSCKRRHFCPSCHQKRVVEFGEWLCMDVIKKIPPTGTSSLVFPRSSAVIFSMTGSFLPI